MGDRPIRVFKGVTKELRRPSWFWVCLVCPPTRGRPVGGSHAVWTFTGRWRKDYPPADVRARRAAHRHAAKEHPPFELTPGVVTLINDWIRERNRCSPGS